MDKQIMIITTTYNNQYHIYDLIQSCARQTYKNFKLIITDDGSTDYTNQMVKEMMAQYEWIEHIKLPHGERGIARVKAINYAEELGYDFLMIIDSDMKLDPDLLGTAVGKMENCPEVGALVIQETPVSKHKNLMTKVKIFERKVINNAYKVDNHSVEAARFWRKEAYVESGGIHSNQISFEEIQPTLRYRDKGGIVERLKGSGLSHDEKKVTLVNLLQKKMYHFEKMPETLSTEEHGFLKAFQRWYFFRPVLYQFNNLWLYIKHPVLALGMIGMYLLLTVLGTMQIMNQLLADVGV